jgi:GH15 family glucan-1,4-alpha-glucosidase
MSSVVKKLIGEITELAFEITNKTKHDVFVRYEGHVNAIIIDYHKNGYYRGINKIKIVDLYMDSEKNHIAKLKEAKRKLKKLLEE